MHRTHWQFPYPADILHVAAKDKYLHHHGRLDWWISQKEQTIEKIKAEGIEVDESMADMISNSYGRQPAVQVRTDLVKDLQECVGKIQEHRAKIADYDAWVQVLESQGKTTFPLNQEDWLFFFGR